MTGNPNDIKISKSLSSELRERVVRMLLEQRGQYKSEHATFNCVFVSVRTETGLSTKLGDENVVALILSVMHPESLLDTLG